MIDYDFEAPAADPFERWLLRRYACGALAAETKRTRMPRVLLARWLIGNAENLDASAPELPPGALDDDKGRVSAETLAALATLIERLLRSGEECAPRTSRLERRLTWLARALRLCLLDAAILGLVVRAALARPVRELLDRLDGNDGPVDYNDETRVRYIAALLRCPLAMVGRRLQADAPLRALGLVEDRGWGDVAPSATVLSLARHGSDNPASLRRLLIGSTAASSLAWSDFAHLGDARALAERVLRDALRRRRRGVNILLYGAPGTGKTEFAKVLAARTGASAVFAGETWRNRRDLEPNRAARIAAVALTGALAARAERTFVVVDEADDIFLGVTGGQGRQGSKVFMHRLVEAVAAPTIWITNEPDFLGEAVVRRMSLVVRFPPPAAAVRERIIERCAARQRLALDNEDRAQLAQMNAPPAILSGAIRTAQRIGGGAATVRQLVGASARLLSGSRAPAVPAAAGFDPSLSAADTDLVALTANIVASGEKALSFCFHGAPGSGKSAYARHLAQRLGLEVVERRTSDLLSKWLGESEKKIRGAFEEAADRQAFLIFDEADSLLANRAGAERSWEISQVNEMLTSMEAHPYPFACTTNAFEALDPAAMRRFLFKVKFLAMTPEQISEAFRRHFAQEAPVQLMRLGGLTPGDFALVARKARMLAETDGMRIADWLVEEVAAKPGSRLNRIGF
jgi:transitional endoplasmic reticulum ATPase